MSNQLLRYKDYFINITATLSISQNDSIITAIKKLKKQLEIAEASSSQVAELQKALD